MTSRSLLFLFVAASLLFVAACALPDSPSTVQKNATLTKTKEAAEKTATDASASVAALQLQVSGLQSQVAAIQPGTAAYADLVRQAQVISAKLDQATAVHDQNVAIAADAQKQIDDLKARTAKNEATLTAFESGAGQVSAGANVIAPFTGPAAPYVLGFGALAAAVGTIVGKVHSAMVTTPRAVGAVEADAKSALEAQTDTANHAATPGATVAGVQNYVATVVSGLTAGAAALYNAAPEVKIPLVTGGSPTGTAVV